MTLEPFQLIGKTIKDCFYSKEGTELTLEFTDGTKTVVDTVWTEDEISGALIQLDHLTMETA